MKKNKQTITIPEELLKDVKKTTIQLEDITLKRLNFSKYDLDCKSLDETINKLLDIKEKHPDVKTRKKV